MLSDVFHAEANLPTPTGVKFPPPPLTKRPKIPPHGRTISTASAKIPAALYVGKCANFRTVLRDFPTKLRKRFFHFFGIFFAALL